MALTPCNTTVDPGGRELAEHGTALFPIACYHDELGKSPVPWHWHDELEALLVVKGQALVKAGNEHYLVKEGEGVFINTGVLHGAWDMRDSGSEFHSLVFHSRLVGGSMDSIFWQNYLQPLLENDGLKSMHFRGLEGSALQTAGKGTGSMEKAIGYIETAWQCCVKEEPGYEFQVREELSKLIFSLVSSRPKEKRGISAKALRDSKRIKLMLQFISEHYGEELSTSGIADAAMISESEALRCFRYTIGTSPMQYVKQLRIHKAAKLLSSTKQKIGDIAAGCGFQDISYFTKTFRELKGYTPGQYRQRFYGKEERSPRDLC